MDEEKILENFIADYQNLSFSDLCKKYGENDDKYWESIQTDKIFKYIKDNSLLDIFIEHNSNANFYSALTRHGSRYRVSFHHDEEWFEDIDSAVFSKIKCLRSAIFSSLRRK